MQKTLLPNILAGAGIAGVGITAVLTGKATLKAADILKSTKPIKQKIKEAAPKYVLPAISGALSVAAIATSTVMHTNNYDTLFSAYMLTSNTLMAYKESVNSVLNKDDAIEVTKNAALINKNPEIEDTGSGDILFVDEFTGRQFLASKEIVLGGEYETNRTFQLKGDIDINYLHNCWGLRDSEIGKQWIWEEYSMATDYDAYWIDFNHIPFSADGREAYVINYPIPPVLRAELD